jgi:hypothetical protein
MLHAGGGGLDLLDAQVSPGKRIVTPAYLGLLMGEIRLARRFAS